MAVTPERSLPAPQTWAGKSEIRWEWAHTFLVLLACTVYVGLALSPSSYALGLEVLGQATSGPWLGQPRGIRSDEWMVFTPYIQIAVENGFAQTNAISPYHESLRSFQALPLLDWSLFFKPYHWGFFFLPAANGYSFYFFFMAFAFVAGWSLLLRRLGISLWIALPTAFALYFSQYIQVWWTTNSGAFSLAPWVAIAWLDERSRVRRILLTAYAITAWMLSCAYPPFLYTAALAIAVLVIAFRRDAISLRSIFDATVSGSIALALFISYFHELIGIMQQTIYPGQRISTSGGVELSRLFTQFSPTFMTKGFEPLPVFTNTNACEIAVLSSLLPLYALVFSDHRRFDEQLSRNAIPFLWIAVGLTVFGAWMYLSVPPIIGTLTGLYLVPASRALLGFGLLVNIAAASYIAMSGVQISARRLIVLITLSIAAAIAKLAFGNSGESDPFSKLDAVPLICCFVIGGGAIWLRNPTYRASLIVSTAALANLLMFGLFNPVQSAYPFFQIDKVAAMEKLQSRGAYVQPDKVIIAPGHYGAIINGAGLPSINHVLYYPQPNFFRKYFPSLPQNEFNRIFNRYSHIEVVESDIPRVGAPDLIRLPWSVLTNGEASYPTNRESPPGPAPRLYALEARPEPSADERYGHVDSMSLSDGGILLIEGWSREPLLDFNGIGYWSDVEFEEVTVERVSRKDVAAAVDPKLESSGFYFRGKLRYAVAQIEVCIVSFNGTDVISTVAFPDGSQTCFSVYSRVQ